MSDWIYLDPGATYLYKVPGADGPFGPSNAKVNDANGVWHTMKDTNCLGNYSSNFSACCWNLVFSVCQKEGQGNTEIRDGDWAFCK